MNALVIRHSIVVLTIALAFIVTTLRMVGVAPWIGILVIGGVGTVFVVARVVPSLLHPLQLSLPLSPINWLPALSRRRAIKRFTRKLDRMSVRSEGRVYPVRIFGICHQCDDHTQLAGAITRIVERAGTAVQVQYLVSDRALSEAPDFVRVLVSLRDSPGIHVDCKYFEEDLAWSLPSGFGIYDPDQPERSFFSFATRAWNGVPFQYVGRAHGMPAPTVFDRAWRDFGQRVTPEMLGVEAAQDPRSEGARTPTVNE